MDSKKINQVMTVIKSVAKKSTKVVGASLPLLSMGAAALDSWKKRPELGPALEHFISKYNGIDSLTGKFNGDLFMQGTGALVLSGIAGWVINQVV